MYIRDALLHDREWIVKVLIDAWSSTRVVSRGVIHQADKLPGIIATRGEEKIGLLTYSIVDTNFEIVTLNSFRKREGIGTALIQEAEDTARSLGCKRIWTVTTNDNSDALKFYRKNGFQIKAIHKEAIEHSRRLKPEIPMVGISGIPITDEIELEKNLT